MSPYIARDASFATPVGSPVLPKKGTFGIGKKEAEK